MRYTLLISAKARQHVRDQRAWYHTHLEDGSALAARWTRLLEQALEKLREQPSRHSPAASHEQIDPRVLVRRMLFRPWQSGKGWRVLFTIDERERSVTVLQIRHERRGPLKPGE